MQPEEAASTAITAELLSQAIDPEVEPQARNHAAQRIQAWLLRTARRTLGRAGCWDFSSAEDLASHVWQLVLCGKCKDLHHFPAWVARVMRNRVTDAWRHRQRAPTVQADLTTCPTADLRCLLESKLDLTSPFSTEDCQQLEKWHQRRRIVVLCLSLLWQKVPQPTWTLWLKPFAIVPPFPPLGFAESEKTEQIGLLAEGLRMSRNGISADFLRGKAHLQQLKFFREITDDSSN